MAGNVRIGVSGWSYAHWRRRFYPETLAQRRRLEYLSGRVATVEINGSFYSLQRPASFRRWYEETPRGFVFAVKGSRFITHMEKLREVERPLANFFASGVLRLAEKLGPILWQFPANISYDEERFARFLELLPRNTDQAAALARRHDARLEGRSWTRAERRQPIRHAFEMRHPSFFDGAFVRLLRRHRAALVLADTAGRFPYAEEITAPFVYIRLHGPEYLYAGSYSDAQLDRWAARVRAWAAGREPRDARTLTHLRPPTARSGRDVYVYFDNDADGCAPFDAIRLARRLGVDPASATARAA